MLLIEQLIFIFAIIAPIIHAQETVPVISVLSNSKQYGIFDSASNWYSARQSCITWGGDLAAIENLEQEQYLFNVSKAWDSVETFKCYIGLHSIDPARETEFVWVDKNSNKYRHSGEKFPADNMGSGCVTTGSNLDESWEIISCNRNSSCYICSKPDTTKCSMIYNDECHLSYAGKKGDGINWLDAQTTCVLWGGNLASIHTQKEQDLYALLSESAEGVWIGLNDREVEGNYSWIDDTALTYTNWSYTPPDNEQRNCVLLNTAIKATNTWRNVDCTVELGGFVCKKDLKDTQDDGAKFGILTEMNGGVDFELLSGTDFFFNDSLTLACAQYGHNILWRYINHLIPGISGVEILDSSSSGFSWVEADILREGFYECKIDGVTKYTAAVFNSSLLTFAVSGANYTYIEGIDREDVQLFCGSMDYPHDDSSWKIVDKSGSLDNPINIYSERIQFSNERTCLECDREYQVTLRIIEPNITKYYDGVPTQSNLSYPEMNTLVISPEIRNISLLVNLEGYWRLPNGIISNKTMLTINNSNPLSSTTFKFCVLNWDKIEKCIQIELVNAYEVKPFSSTPEQVDYIVGSEKGIYYFNTSIPDEDIFWKIDPVSDKDNKSYSNPTGIREIFSDVGAGQRTLSCFYLMEMLGSILLNIKDTAELSITYEGFNQSFSDENNPMFPNPQKINVTEGTQNIYFTCNLSECVWEISHQRDTIKGKSYAIPKISSEFSGNISLIRTAASGVEYTTATIILIVSENVSTSRSTTMSTTHTTSPNTRTITNATLPNAPSEDPIALISVIALLAVIILLTIPILVTIIIFATFKWRHNTRLNLLKRTGIAPPNIKMSTLTATGDEMYVEHPPSFGYMTIDETSASSRDMYNDRNKVVYVNTAAEGACNTPKVGHYINIDENMSESDEHSAKSSLKEKKRYMPKFIPTNEFYAIYQECVDSGIGRDSLFGKEFEILNEYCKKYFELECEEGRKMENHSKNPVKNIIPFDENRVVLISPHFECEYINASYINDHQYIASLHPTKETHRDFLQMIYQTEASMVIMLTTRKEKAKIISGISNRVCYWPKKDEPINCEPFVVTLNNSSETDAFLKQEIRLKDTSTGKEHTFTHCISSVWNEDGSVSEMAPAVVLFNKILKQKQNSNDAPIIIHCEDGISKTGVIMTVLNSIRDISLRKSINIFNAVRVLRGQRMSMVPTLACYISCYSLVNEYCSIYL